MNSSKMNAPEWIQAWPKQYKTLFSLPIQNQAVRMIGKINMQKVQWNPTTLHCTFERKFVSRWIFKDDKWDFNCSCGFPKSKCIHNFILGFAFNKIATEQKWTSNLKPGTAQLNRQEKERESKISQSLNSRLKDSKEATKPVAVKTSKELVVEVDTSRGVSEFMLRFYAVQNDERKIFRMQNLLQTCANTACNRDRSWSEKDSTFLRWLYAHVNKPHVWKGNLSVMKITEGKFKIWVKHWNEQHDRFLEKDSQKPFFLNIHAGLSFELDIQGDKTFIHCYVGSSVQNRQAFHEVYKTIKNASQVVINDNLMVFKPEVGLETLLECFSKKSPSMPTAKVCQFLPAIIENHLELLGGDFITKVNQDYEVSIHAKSGKSGIELLPRVHKYFIDPDAGPHAASMIKKKDGFEVHQTESQTVKEVKAFLKSLSYTKEGERLRLTGDHEDVKKFILAWRLLPQKVKKSCDPSISALLNQTPVDIDASVNLRQNGNYLDYSFSWQAGAQQLSKADLQTVVKNHDPLIRTQSGNWLFINQEQARQALNSFNKLNLNTDQDRVFNFEADKILDIIEQHKDLRVHKNSRELAKNVRSFNAKKSFVLSDTFDKILRNYQKEGFQFISKRLQHEVGVVLADDMGLGKTVQTLAIIDSIRKVNKNKTASIVVAPASVIYVWKNEAKKFLPDLKVEVLVGNKAQRKKTFSKLDELDLVVASYGTIRSDIAELTDVKFSLCILDEAHSIKNPRAKVTQAVKSLQAQYRLALSGTPIENKVTDIWSLMDFLNPGYLGFQRDFENRYNNKSLQGLSEKVSPLLLRRTKKKVLKELPAKTDEILYCDLLPKQSLLYQNELSQSRQKVAESNQRMQIFAALTRLRQICCDSRLHLKDKLPEDWNLNEVSAKLNSLVELVENLKSEGHSVLVFSQFTSMLDLIEEKLKNEISLFRIDGTTPVTKRPQIIEKFDAEESASAFLLSLKAAGTGLTLTKASYVVLFDPWWNPAIEAQAVDRAYRIGQKNTVFAYRLIAKDTVEEKVLQMQQKKKELADSIINQDNRSATKITKNDLLQLFD